MPPKVHYKVSILHLISSQLTHDHDHSQSQANLTSSCPTSSPTTRSYPGMSSISTYSTIYTHPLVPQHSCAIPPLSATSRWPAPIPYRPNKPATSKSTTQSTSSSRPDDR